MPSVKQPQVEISDDDEEDQLETPVAPPVKTKRSKEKQQRTPAQQEAFKKALAVLKEKRESKAREEKEKFEKASAEEKERIQREKFEKARNHRKKLPPAPSYITTAEFGGALERFKTDLLSAIPKALAPAPVAVQEEKPQREEKPKPQVKKVVVEEPEEVAPPKVVKPKAEPKPAKQLTGHELLDKLFFN